MALEIGIVGLPNAGKTTIFNVLTRAGAEITAYATVSEKANVGMAAIEDDRLDRVAELVKARKVTPAAVRVVDVPGTGPALLGNLRQVDAILAVLDGWSGSGDPDSDLETLRLELLFADRDYVEKRLERVSKQAKSGDATLRKEADDLTALLAHLEAGNTLADWTGDLPRELEPLTTKPLLPLVNGPDGIDGKLELELADMPEEEAAEFVGAFIMMHPNGFTHGERLTHFYFNNVLGNPLDTTLALHNLIFSGTLARFPDLKLMAVHGGGYLPGYSGRIDHAWGARQDSHGDLPLPPTTYLRQVYLDTVVFTYHQLASLIDVFGPDRIVMGTDYPFDMAEYNPIGHIAGVHGMDEATLAQIAGGNAARVLGMDV